MLMAKRKEKKGSTSRHLYAKGIFISIIYIIGITEK